MSKASAYSLLLINPPASASATEGLLQLLRDAIQIHDISKLFISGAKAGDGSAWTTEAYKVAGQLRRNLSVEHTAYETLSEAEHLVGVLVWLDMDGLNPPADRIGLLDSEHGEFGSVLENVLGLLHATATSSIPILRGDLVGPVPFYAVAMPPATHTSYVTNFIDHLLSQLQSEAPHVQIGHAVDIIKIPAPNTTDEKLENDDGSLHVSVQNHGDAGSLEASPTKLWAEWALQEELG